MMTNDFEKVFNFVSERLFESEMPLETSKIQNAVNDIKDLAYIENGKLFEKIVKVSSEFKGADFNWEGLAKELEKHFDVKMPEGFLIQGEEQQKKDNTWWTKEVKSNAELYYWNRYKKFISKDFSPEVIRTIDVDTDVTMNNISNPKEKRFSTYGMVVGHVQSGKTANYSALISKACDAGYKFIIVIAGGINNLRNQTQVRINEAIIGTDGGNSVGVGKLGGVKKSKTPSSLTTTLEDFNKRDADKSKGSINFDTINVPVIMVIKKQTNTLTNVISWLNANYNNSVVEHAMLLIDDESDYASINTKKDDEDPSTINRKIRQLMSIFYKSAYVAYTATPFANIFIDYKVDDENYGLDLFPKDFIIALNAPDNYFGAKKIFLDNYSKYIVHIDEDDPNIPMRHKKDFDINKLPESLEEAIRVFIINIAIRRIRGQVNKHNSMLIHVSRFTDIHVKVAYFVDEYLNELKRDITAYGLMPNSLHSSKHIAQMKLTFESSLIFTEYEWGALMNEVIKFLRGVQVREVHQRTKIKLSYSEEPELNVIAIGGASLSRGFTLEGLSVSYFLRTTKMYDTLMQMGRWFGYRIGYEDLCKIFIPESIGEYFINIIEATENLFDDFRRMADAKKTPNDFGLSVAQNPDSALQVTAYNKLRHATDYYFDMNLDGSEKETTCLKKDEKIRKNNLEAIELLVTRINTKENKTLAGKKNIWIDIDKNQILSFLNGYSVYSVNPHYVTAKMPIDFIKEYASEIDTKWDVMLASGNQGKDYSIGSLEFRKEFRKMEDKGDYIEANQRQISSGLLERVLFPKEAVEGKNRKDLRGLMTKPLLVLHIIDVKTDEGKDEGKFDSVAAFGISFPGGINSEHRIVRHKINKVYVDQIIKDSEQESEDNE